MGKFGLEFKSRQKWYTGVPSYLYQCYPFQGAPDITIKKYTPIVLAEDPNPQPEVEGQELERESGSKPDYVIENAQQALQQVQTEYPSKLGELLANMHIMVVKKILRSFVHKRKRENMNLVSRGLLLHKATGGTMCEMSVEFKKQEGPMPITISVCTFGCGVLTPPALCYQLHKLLHCDLHRTQYVLRMHPTDSITIFAAVASYCFTLESYYHSTAILLVILR